MRYVLYVLLLVWGGPVNAEIAIKYRLTVSPEVMEEMNEIARRDTGARDYPEDFLCLTGVVVQKDGVTHGTITGVYRPRQDRRIASVTPKAMCPVNQSPGSRNTIGVWHTHPRGTCALSGTSPKSPQGGDIAYSLARPWFAFMVVQTDPDRWCWIHRQQIIDLLQKNKKVGRELKDIPFLVPPDNQHIQGKSD